MATTLLRPFPLSFAIKNTIKGAVTTLSTTSISLAWLSPRPSIQSQYPNLSCSFPFLLQYPNKARHVFSILAVVDGETVVTEEVEEEETVNEDVLDQEFKEQDKPCELYVCNLPRNCDISELSEMFEPYGTVISVEVSRNRKTGVSRGCGYVTMGSVNSARTAISALDGTDVGGREVRVRYSVEMGSDRRNPWVLNSGPARVQIYESPYKIYIGNLPWAIRPVDLRDRFSMCGTVVSARVMHDRKGGKNRAYGFLSFSSPAERDTALSFNGTDFYGRSLVVRKSIERVD